MKKRERKMIREDNERWTWVEFVVFAITAATTILTAAFLAKGLAMALKVIFGG